MAKFDTEALLTPISDDAPSGPNLEYDLEFTSLEQAAAPKAEKVIGDSVIAGEEPDWENVASRAEALLVRSKDLRVALHLATAWLRLGGLEGGAAGLGLIRGIVENFWGDFHPQLDADDDDDPTFRVNSIAPLASLNGWLKYLRITPFIASQRLGKFTLRDLRIANGSLKVPVKPPTGEDDEEPAQPAVPTMALIEGCCKDAALELLSANTAAANLALEHAKAIDRAFTDKLGSAGPDLKNLVVECFELKKFLDPQLAARRPAAAPASVIADDDYDEDDDGSVPAAVSGSVRSGKAFVSSTGPISGPDDVRRRLDEICDYYAEAEPSSPVPLLLRRAQRLVGRSFIELLQDLAPSGVAQVQVVSGPITATGSSTAAAGSASASPAAAANYDDDD